MTQRSELDLKYQELELRRQELAFRREQLFVDFAKYGFMGTLTAAIVGMAFLLFLAAISAFTPYKVDGFILFGMMFLLLIAALAFGYLSLWALPKIAARFKNLQLQVDPSESDRLANDRHGPG